MRTGLGNEPRRKLLHVLPSIKLDTMAVFALRVIQNTPDYHHVVVHTDDPGGVGDHYMWHMQATGADLFALDSVDNMLPDINTFAAAILYDPRERITLPIPVIYYAYSTYREDVKCDALIAPGDYAVNRLNINPDYIIPPAIRSRNMRSLYRTAKKKVNRPFTIGLFSSGAGDKYPVGVANYLLQKLDKRIRLFLTYNAGVTKLQRPGTHYLPVVLDANLRGMTECDILIYAHGQKYAPSYGRHCLEMLASGIPVLCERRGAPAEMYKDGTELLFYNKPDELRDYIEELHKNESLAEGLGANAQLRASWQDLLTHIGTLKGVLRGLGA